MGQLTNSIRSIALVSIAAAFTATPALAQGACETAVSDLEVLSANAQAHVSQFSDSAINVSPNNCAATENALETGLSANDYLWDSVSACQQIAFNCPMDVERRVTGLCEDLAQQLRKVAGRIDDVHDTHMRSCR